MLQHRAVVDTNVVYVGLYSAAGASYQILRLIDQVRVVPILSTTLLFEYEDVLRWKSQTLGLSEQAIDDVLDGLCTERNAGRSISSGGRCFGIRRMTTSWSWRSPQAGPTS